MGLPPGHRRESPGPQGTGRLPRQHRVNMTRVAVEKRRVVHRRRPMGRRWCRRHWWRRVPRRRRRWRRRRQRDRLRVQRRRSLTPLVDAHRLGKTRRRCGWDRLRVERGRPRAPLVDTHRLGSAWAFGLNRRFGSVCSVGVNFGLRSYSNRSVQGKSRNRRYRFRFLRFGVRFSPKFPNLDMPLPWPPSRGHGLARPPSSSFRTDPWPPPLAASPIAEEDRRWCRSHSRRCRPQAFRRMLRPSPRCRRRHCQPQPATACFAPRLDAAAAPAAGLPSPLAPRPLARARSCRCNSRRC
jgi:hypothetical protein